MASARRDRKPSSSRNREKGAWLLKLGAAFAVICVLLVVAAGWFVMTSSLFALREVEAYGNKYLSKGKLAQMMGVKYGENLVALPSDEAAGMLAESKWIKSVSLRKEYPGKLVVRIEEAAPQALLEVMGEVYFVDSEGDVLEKLKDAPAQFLPVIVSAPLRNPATFKEAVKLAGVIRAKGLTAENDRIEIIGVEKGPESLAMNIGGLTAKVGQGDYEEKLRRLAELSDEIKRRHVNIQYVDLRFANSVVVKPFEEEAVEETDAEKQAAEKQADASAAKEAVDGQKIHNRP